MRNFLLVLFCLVVSITIHAQENYIPGSVVTNSGDSLSGYIDYRNWRKNPRKIDFKRTIGGQVQSFDVAQAQSFHLPNKDTYIRYVVWKDIQPVDVSNLETGNNNRLIKDTVFLRMLVAGDKLSLFELTEDKNYFFIKGENDSLLELQYKRFYDPQNSSRMITSTFFRNQLKRYTPLDESNRKLINAIDGALYTENDLIPIVTRINQKTDYTIRSSQEKEKTNKFFVGAGISYHTMELSGSNNVNMLNFSSSTGYIVSAGMDLFSPRGKKKLFGRFELGYGKNSFEGNATQTLFNGDIEEREYKLTLSNLNLSVTALYTLWKQKETRLYAGLGVGFNFTSYPTNTYYVTNKTTSSVSITQNYLEWEKTWQAMLVQVGIMVNGRVSLNARANIAGKNERFTTLDKEGVVSNISIFYHFK